MAIPQEILQWVQTTYPNPQIDPEWLQACLTYLHTDLNIPFPPHGPLAPVLSALDDQILHSDLCESMLPGTGLPGNAGVLNDVRLWGRGGGVRGVLVQIVGLTEIGNSAFNLMGVMKAREERGVVPLHPPNAEHNAGEVDEEDQGPLQRYPRSMLSFELSDGSTTIRAIEYRDIPQLELGGTPLGYKILLKNPLIRRGVAFLEPGCINLLGGLVQDREDLQEALFRRSLRVRLGQVIQDDVDDDNNNNQHPPHPQPPQPLPHQQQQPHQPHLPNRPPFRNLSPPPSPPDPPTHDDDMDAPRRRKVPSSGSKPPNSNDHTYQNAHASGSGSGPGASRSAYFSENSSGTTSGTSMSKEMEILSRERILSPVRSSTATISSNSSGPILVPSSPSPPPATRRIAHLPARVSPSSTITSETRAGKARYRNKENYRPPSSDGFESDYFGMDDMMLMDDAALEELDLIEVGVSSAVGPSGHSTSTGPASSSLLGSVVVPARREEQIQETHVESDIIVIDSEDDEGDKENMPIPTRHVRRRTQQRVEVQLNDDVIDISSSE